MNAFSFNKLQGLKELLGLWRPSSPALTEKEIRLPGGMTSPRSGRALEPTSQARSFLQLWHSESDWNLGLLANVACDSLPKGKSN